MPGTTLSIDTMISGVSQQPDALRIPSQAEEQINAYSSVIDGLQKRPPTTRVSELISGSILDFFPHEIDRDSSERYLVNIYDGDVRIFDLDGTEIHVEDQTGGFGYLSGYDPDEDFKALTVADYTFVLNDKVVTQMAATLSPTAPTFEAYIFVSQGDLSSEYIVELDIGAGVTTSTTNTWDGTTGLGGGTGNLDSYKTTDIAEDIRVQLGAIVGVTATRQGSVVKVTAATAATTLKVSDSVADSALILIWEEVPRFTDLPTVCGNDFRVKVSGDPDEGTDDYFVKFVTGDASVFGNGIWEETLDYDTLTSIDNTTMPHQLVRQTDDGAGTITGTPNAIYFDFDRVTWDDRLVGDTTLNPDPSFIGNTIADLMFHKNRFGFLSDDKEILSSSGSFFNFFRTTVRSLLDDDPIDVGSNHTRVSFLHHGVGHNGKLLTFSSKTQFTTDGIPNLTPKTVQIVPVAEFECDPNATPVSTGRTVFFAQPQGDFSLVRELYQIGDSEKYDAEHITAHTPKYIQGNIIDMEASTLADMLVVRSDADLATVYVYKFFWDGDNKAQSSWSKFTFDGDVKAAKWFDDELYLMVNRNGSLDLEKMSLAAGTTDPNTDHIIHLDRRIQGSELISATYDAATNQTTFVLPYDKDVGSSIAAVKRDGDSGVTLTEVSQTTTDLVVRGDHTSDSLWFGQLYSMEYTMSRPLLKRQNSDGSYAVVTAGETQLIRGHIQFEGAGFFEAQVIKGSRTFRTKFTGPRLGTPQLVLGTFSTTSGVFSFPIRSAPQDVTIKLVNGTALPSTFIKAEVELWYDSRVSR